MLETLAHMYNMLENYRKGILRVESSQFSQYDDYGNFFIVLGL